MLRVGLTGGIGSGKSTAARRFAERGALLVDSDLLAREAVAPGTDGLAEIVAAFGEQVLGIGGELDRAALAAIVFGGPAARERLNGIVHPRVRRRSEELIAAVPADAIVVQDVPLLVEAGMAPAFPLVVVVHSDAEVRIRRLVRHRGIAVADARARIAVQANDAIRRAAADVWLDNDGSPADLRAAVDSLWDARLVAFEENLRLRRPAEIRPHRLVAPDPAWPADAARLAARVAAAAGDRARGVAHIGPSAVPGLPAPDVIDLLLGVDALTDANALRDALADAGFPLCHSPPRPGVGGGPDRSGCDHVSADPGRAARLEVHPVGSSGWRSALLWRDWLRADAPARETFRTLEQAQLVEASPGWFHAELSRSHAEAWSASTEWVPSVN